MALEANAATFNAAMDTLLAAWEAYTDAIAGAAEIQVVKMKRRQVSSTSDSLGVDSAQLYDFGKKFKGYNTPDVADSLKLTVGASGPLFFKVTNDSNELS